MLPLIIIAFIAFFAAIKINLYIQFGILAGFIILIIKTHKKEGGLYMIVPLFLFLATLIGFALGDLYYWSQFYDGNQPKEFFRWLLMP